MKKVLISFLLINLIAVTGVIRAAELELNQAITVTGTVTDMDNVPLAGVNVIEKGTSNGTITDLDGKYTITVSGSEAVLSFSFIGYVLENVTVGEQKVINMSLLEDLVGLDEVVVVGYGTVKKSDITGSVSSVTSEQINEMPATNVNQAIQGRAAGVDVVNTSYGLNSKPQIRIRGNRSILAGNDPLYVVDGVPINGSIQDINPGDIESLEILKDASASAIYGSRAANGVILITTKRGKAGQFNVTVEGSWTFSNPLRYYDQLSGHDWMEMARDNQRSNTSRYSTPYPNPEQDYKIISRWPSTAWSNAQQGYEWLEEPGENPDDWNYKMRAVTDDERTRWGEVMDVVPDSVPVYNAGNVGSYDWYGDGMNSNALAQQYNISMSGGTEKVSAYFSLGYVNQEGLGVGENFQRINPRLNVDINPVDWLTVGASASFGSEFTDPGEGLLGGVTSMIPITTPYDTSGAYLMLPTGDQVLKNPLNNEELNVQENRVQRYIGAYFAEISFTDALKYRLNVSQDYRHYSNGDYRDEESAARFPQTNYARWQQGEATYTAVENLLFYNKEFGIHRVGVTLLQSIETNKSNKMEASADNLPMPTALWYRLASAPTPSEDISYGDPGNAYRETRMASVMGRVNYSLLDKYLLTASLRYDGSSVFYGVAKDRNINFLNSIPLPSSDDNRWDYFPSFAFAWKVHQESFMQTVTFLNQLKFRLGYGTVGQSSVAPYESSGTLKETQYVFYNPSAGDDESAKGLAPDDLETRSVGWEKTATTNIGIDFGMFQNRVSGTVEWYRANTYDLLMDKNIPAINGTTSIRANVGKTQNQGIELTLSTFNVDRGDFRWETDFTFMHNTEQIVELADGETEVIGSSYYWKVGEPIGTYYTFAYDGIWQVGDSAQMNLYNSNGGNTFKVGEIRPKDVDGNDTINASDKQITGNNVPKYSFGMTNRLHYKGFEFSFFLYARQGHSIYSRDGHYFPMSTRGTTPFLTNYYKPMATADENADADHPAPTNARDKYEGALYVRDASFIRIRNITLSYNLPQDLLNKANIQSLKVSLQILNPFLFTDYPYLDPEAQNSNPIRTPAGISSRGVTLGLRVGL